MQLYIKCYIVTKHNFQFTHPLQGCGAVSEAGSPVCGRANTHFCGTNCVSKYLDTLHQRGCGALLVGPSTHRLVTSPLT